MFPPNALSKMWPSTSIDTCRITSFTGTDLQNIKEKIKGPCNIGQDDLHLLCSQTSGGGGGGGTNAHHDIDH